MDDQNVSHLHKLWNKLHEIEIDFFSFFSFSKYNLGCKQKQVKLFKQLIEICSFKKSH